MSDTDTPADHEVVIKNGFFVRVIAYRSIKIITALLLTFLVIDVLYSIKLFVSAIQIRSHLGYYINMISSGGDTLPSLQAVPVLFFFIINFVMAFFVYSVFEQSPRADLNRLMYFVIMLSFVLLIIILIIIICVIAHAYSTHEKLHDGIVTAMNHYLNSTVYKSQIDRLQIEFQCCGSKKYDEWYTVKWMDPSLEQGAGPAADGNTPFSCCSMKSLSPCIHHNIEVTGKAYLYTPEFNLSISTRGCYEMIRKKKQEMGWLIVGNLFLFIFLESVSVALFRFLQTAHFAKGRFMGHRHSYTIWLFGCYSGVLKKEATVAPPPPPVPAELQN
ncbi:rod outer segment membrane protein 1-like [Zophobas morio]|uniref:rod outer segment membrane protein 1-like n=1 Tax=Zophobas morio TaxID=2755281 RepID=UPI0030829A33